MGEYTWPRCEFRKKEEIREIVDEFRQTYWKSGSIPIDMERIVEDMGLAIIPVHGIRDPHLINN
jgi:hypothetical protein